MTKETETLGLVFQSENFNYNRYNNYIMDSSWSYLEGAVPEPNQSKSLLVPEDNLTAITMLYEHCKTQKELKTPINRASGICKAIERTPTNNNLVSLDTSANVIKILSDSIPSSHPQDVMGTSVCTTNKHSTSLPASVAATSDTYTTLTSVVADTYDKQDLNNIFDTLLQKWPDTETFPDPNTETLPYSDHFLEDQSSPVYSGSYSGSPPERYKGDFQFSLGAPSASSYKSSELPMVYLNKGQFYPITLHGVDSTACVTANKVKTVIMAVFENDKTPEMQLRFWNHWHARQPTVKQRVIDIDYKEVFSGINNIEEVAFNAFSFVWNPNEEAKVYIGINSLSTDFSAQKGVKGLPLNLQIDTYDFSSGTNQLIHRAACQIKIFCDKGAERKMRDEERKRTKRRGKSTSDVNTNKSLVSSSMGSDCTFFQTLDDHITQPVLFIPETHLSSLQRCGLASTLDGIDRSSMKRLYSESAEQSGSPSSKQARREDSQRVLLYVRSGAQEVFDALMLNTPTLMGLREAISEKYGVQKDTIGKIYKKCKRGIFVNMDDNIIEHYSNQLAFLIEMSEVVAGQFQVTLVEL
ncbi:grainyhead-like protein 3 homolog isoform X2 [Thalassophryne amazonica]|uniref:grainyhead-like protein 3 homolog isoform X2 n=1 Tax=Thalassophryne amazonica TaxID=390379 RepID=UPI001471EFD2|nr:grainyhead-like protein 3 homolog isoform X2 [Thalassophryne amazonica]